MDQLAFLREHEELTRRYFLKVGVLGTAAGAMSATAAFGQEAAPAKPRQKPDKAGALPDSYFTPAADFRDVSRGKPIPHTLDEAKRREAGSLVRPGSWRSFRIPITPPSFASR
jgi:hypothetical protein